MADFKQNNKDAKEYYETQQKIAEVVKRQTENWETYGDAVKSAARNAKLIKEQQKEINRLEAEGTQEAILKAEELKKQQAQLIQINKEMLKLSTAGKAFGSSMKNAFKNGMAKLRGGAMDLLAIYDEMDKSSRSAAIETGMSVKRMNQFRMIAAKSASEMARVGLGAEVAGQMQKAFSDETGRQVMLSKKALIQMGQLSKRTGIGAEEMATFAGEMESFGMSSTGAAAMLESIADLSDKAGVNTQKVMKDVQKNLSLVNKFSFKNGVKGLAKAVAYTQKMKLEMADVASFAEKVYRPEGAIDAAANLQVLGGEMAKLGDPMKMMYEARNNPEEFAKSIVSATGAVAVFNKKTGAFEVNGMQLDRLREAADATGIPLENLVKTAKQSSKINMFADAIKLKGDDRALLEGMMEVDGGGAFVINHEGDKQYLKDLTASEQQLLAKRDENAKRELEVQSTQERVTNELKAAISKLLPGMVELDNTIRGPLVNAIEQLGKYIDKLLGLSPKIGLLIAAIGAFIVAWPLISAALAPIGWLLRGRMLAKGFNMGMKSSKFMDQMTGGAAGGKQGKFYKGGQFMKGGGRAPKGGAFGGAGKGAAGTQAMGQSAGGQASNFLQGAVALLAISAALFVFAKALQEFEKLQNGWQTLVLAAGSLVVLGLALKFMQPVLSSFGSSAWPGIAAMGALAVSVMALGFATTLFAQGGLAGTLLMVGALFALSGAVLLFGGLSLGGIGWAGVALILALGAAMIMMGYATKLMAEGLAIVIDSFTRMFEVVNSDNIVSLLLLGPALIGISIGVFALAASLVALGAAYVLGGFLGIFALGETADKIEQAFGDIDPGAVAAAITAINNVDMDKVAAIKSLANSMSMWSMWGGGIKVDMGDLDVKGSIKLKSDDSEATTNWINDPIFVSKLKDVIFEDMEAGQNGGKN